MQTNKKFIKRSIINVYIYERKTQNMFNFFIFTQEALPEKNAFPS